MQKLNVNLGKIFFNKKERMVILILVISLASQLIAVTIYFAYQFVDLRLKNSTTIVTSTDCIVVLGAAVWPGGRPSPVFGDRLLRAAQLYREGIAHKIICSGGVGKYPPAEAKVGREFLLNAGVADVDILLETVGSSTSEQVGLIKTICDREGFKSIALVTSFFHEKRADHYLREAG